MQFGSISSPAQQTLSTTAHKPGTVCFSYTCANVGYTPNQSHKTHTTAHEKANWPFTCSHLVFPALQVNLGISLITLEMTSNIHTALLIHKQCRMWCKSMCPKTHFPSPDSLWKDPSPAYCRAAGHVWQYGPSLGAGMGLCVSLTHASTQQSNVIS